jgi:hypothetical protein
MVAHNAVNEQGEDVADRLGMCTELHRKSVAPVNRIFLWLLHVTDVKAAEKTA